MANVGDLSIRAITDLRKAGRPVEALRQLCSAAYQIPCPDLMASEFYGAPSTPLSGAGRTCLLLEAARHRAGTSAADDPGFAEWFNSKVRSTQWSQLFPDLFGSADGDNPADDDNHWRVLAGLRRDLALLVHSPGADSGIEKSLVRIVQGYEAAFALPSGGSWPASTSEPSWLASSIPEEFKNALRHCAQTTSWASPAIHFAGQTLLYLLGSELPAPSGTATTKILGVDHSQQDGFVLHLVVEAIPNGTGVIIPHPLYAGYLATDEAFQHALLRAITAIQEDLPEPRHDFRWTIWFPDEVGLQGSLPTVSGGSAGAALYCAMRAAATGEPLDDQAVITAALTDSSALSQIGGLSEKLLATRDRQNLRLARIRRILVSSDQLWESHLLPATGHQIPVDQWKIHLQPVPDRQSAYQQLTEYAKLARAIKSALAEDAHQLLEGEQGLCRPYLRPRFAEQRPPERRLPNAGSDGGQEPQVRMLSEEENAAMLTGTALRARSRILILADSGMGKSSFLLAAEREIARRPDLRVPIRLGAGPKSTRVLSDGRPVSMSPLSDLFESRDVLSEVLLQFRERLPPELSGTLDVWLPQAIARGDAVFLLDAIDQTAGDIKLPRFLRDVLECPAIVTGRPEIKKTRRESTEDIDWQSELRIDNLRIQRSKRGAGRDAITLPDSDIDRYCETDSGLADRLLGNREWVDLIQTPVILSLLRELHRKGENGLTSLRNREAVYNETLQMLLSGGRSGTKHTPLRRLSEEEQEDTQVRLALYAWEMWEIADSLKMEFTGETRGTAFSELKRRHQNAITELQALNITTHQSYFDGTKQANIIAWRHKSFGEWFAGLHLATLDEKRQREFFEKHARSADRGWVIAFAMSAAQRLADEGRLSPEVAERMARWLIEYGNPFHLRRTIDQQKLTISDELNSLCNWLVHRDSEFRKVVAERPVVDEQIAEILDTMFALDSNHRPKHRDSRWLDAAWELVRDTAGGQNGGRSSGDDVSGRTPSPPAPLPGGEGRKKGSWQQKQTPQEICRAIHNRFLGEFENRLNQYATIRSDKDRAAWRHQNRGLIQLVPEECREALGLPAPDLDAIRTWPADPFSPFPEGVGPGGRASLDSPPSPDPILYAQLRDQFNQRLQDHHVNWCLCPPKNWLHPHGRHRRVCRVGDEQERESHYLMPDYYLQRTPVTNIQFEAFDPDHKQFRQTKWKRDNEPKETALDDHPVVEVTWFQARMLAIWMTGLNKRFGTFTLPDEKDWEACCRAGRDAEGEITGVPWINAEGQEHFDVLTSQQTNFDGNYPLPDRDDLKGAGYPYHQGTVPVGQYRANGFGLVDMQGQVWEWQLTPWDGLDWLIPSSKNERIVTRAVRGGPWKFNSIFSLASHRFKYEAEDRDNVVGFRLSWTFLPFALLPLLSLLPLLEGGVRVTFS
jgi:formylglycine-generating enzyme required for sulfatase activity